MNQPFRRSRAIFLFVTLLAAAPLLSLLIAGDFAVYTRGEGREGLVVKAILEDNSFILPLRNGIDVPSKPPFYHWCAALITKLGAFSPELSLRLPSAIFAGIVGVYLFVFLRNRFGDLLAVTTTAMTVCSFEWQRTAQSARVDMTFYFAVIVTLLFLYELFEDNTNKLRLSLIAGATMGMACLAKGPAGLIIPLAIAGIYSLLTISRFKRSVGFLALSAVVAAAIGASWYFAAYSVGGEKFLEVQLLKENLARISGDHDYDLGHKSGPLSIFGLLLVGTLPFSLLLVPLLRYAWRMRRTLFQNLDQFSVYCLIWLAVFLLVFGASASKRGVYLVGCFPAFSYLLVRFIQKITEVNEDTQAFFRRTVIWIFALLAIILTKAWLLGLFGKELIVAQIKKQSSVELAAFLLNETSALIAVGGILIVLWFVVFDQARRNLTGGIWAMAVISTLISTFVGVFVLPAVSLQQSPKNFMTEAAPHFAKSRLNFQEDQFFAATYYANRQLLLPQHYSELKPGEAGFLIRAEGTELALPKDINTVETILQSDSFNIQGHHQLELVRIERQK